MSSDSKTQPLVSILIPAYNCEKYLVKCLESILAQSYTNVEILIADDGSRDKTRKIIESINDTRIKPFYNKKNRGNLYTINYLLSRSVGEYIAFQDADDWSDPDRIYIQAGVLDDNPDIYLCGTGYKLEGFDGILSEDFNMPITDAGIREFIDKYERLPFLSASCMIKRSAYEKVGNFRNYFDKIGAADYDWNYRIIENFKVVCVPSVLYFYRANVESTTFTITTNLKQRISEKIAFFLYSQRRETGVDSLMRNNLKEIDLFSKNLLEPYYKDPSLIYNKMAMSNIHKRKPALSLMYILIGIYKKPRLRKNYSLLKYWIWKNCVDRKYNTALIKQY